MSTRARRRSQEDEGDKNDATQAIHREESSNTTPRERALTTTQPRPVTVIASLNDASCYEADDATTRISRDGEILPTKSRRKTFGPGLHRLRDRLRHLDERLQLDINGLKQEVINLQLHKSLVETKMQAQWTRQADAAVQCVTEYFGAFEFGWLEMPQDTMRNAGVGSDQQRLLMDRRRLLADRQRHFVETALHPAMQFGKYANGIVALMNHWKIYSTSLDDVRFWLESVDCDCSSGSPLVIAKGFGSGVVTEQSVRVLFPHLDPNGRLAQRLIGSRITCPCTVSCYFETSTQIVRFLAESNAVQGLKELLGDLELVAEALTGSYLAKTHT